mgnify:CR=1 FL=1
MKVNDHDDIARWWEVIDRTTGEPLDAAAWHYDAATESVVIDAPAAYHEYTVSFLAWRTWEEINMYNHVTNSWTSEHLLPVDPRTKEAQDFLYDWLRIGARPTPRPTWCGLPVCSITSSGSGAAISATRICLRTGAAMTLPYRKKHWMILRPSMGIP